MATKLFVLKFTLIMVRPIVFILQCRVSLLYSTLYSLLYCTIQQAVCIHTPVLSTYSNHIHTCIHPLVDMYIMVRMVMVVLNPYNVYIEIPCRGILPYTMFTIHPFTISQYYDKALYICYGYIISILDLICLHVFCVVFCI